MKDKEIARLAREYVETERDLHMARIAHRAVENGTLYSLAGAAAVFHEKSAEMCQRLIALIDAVADVALNGGDE